MPSFLPPPASSRRKLACFLLSFVISGNQRSSAVTWLSYRLARPLIRAARRDARSRCSVRVRMPPPPLCLPRGNPIGDGIPAGRWLTSSCSPRAWPWWPAARRSIAASWNWRRWCGIASATLVSDSISEICRPWRVSFQCGFSRRRNVCFPAGVVSCRWSISQCKQPSVRCRHRRHPTVPDRGCCTRAILT